MKTVPVSRLVVLSLILALPAPAFAQISGFSGSANSGVFTGSMTQSPAEMGPVSSFGSSPFSSSMMNGQGREQVGFSVNVQAGSASRIMGGNDGAARDGCINYPGRAHNSADCSPVLAWDDSWVVPDKPLSKMTGAEENMVRNYNLLHDKPYVFKYAGAELNYALPLFAELPPSQGASAQVIAAALPAGTDASALRQSVANFVASNTQQTAFPGKIALWRQGICPETQGFVGPLADTVTRHVREVATKIGVPVDTNAACAPNVMIYFTRDPQTLLPQLARREGADATQALAAFTQPVRAWYTVAGNAKDADQIGRIAVVADSNKLDAYDVDTLGDYVAMLALSQARFFAACQQNQTITNLLTQNCADIRKSKDLREIDVSYLSALNHSDTSKTLPLQQAAIAQQMEVSLEGKTAN